MPYDGARGLSAQRPVEPLTDERAQLLTLKPANTFATQARSMLGAKLHEHPLVLDGQVTYAELIPGVHPNGYDTALRTRAPRPETQEPEDEPARVPYYLEAREHARVWHWQRRAQWGVGYCY